MASFGMTEEEIEKDVRETGKMMGWSDSKIASEIHYAKKAELRDSLKTKKGI